MDQRSLQFVIFDCDRMRTRNKIIEVNHMKILLEMQLLLCLEENELATNRKVIEDENKSLEQIEISLMKEIQENHVIVESVTEHKVVKDLYKQLQEEYTRIKESQRDIKTSLNPITKSENTNDTNQLKEPYFDLVQGDPSRNSIEDSYRQPGSYTAVLPPMQDIKEDLEKKIRSIESKLNDSKMKCDEDLKKQREEHEKTIESMRKIQDINENLKKDIKSLESELVESRTKYEQNFVPRGEHDKNIMKMQDINEKLKMEKKSLESKLTDSQTKYGQDLKIKQEEYDKNIAASLQENEKELANMHKMFTQQHNELESRYVALMEEKQEKENTVAHLQSMFTQKQNELESRYAAIMEENKQERKKYENLELELKDKLLTIESIMKDKNDAILKANELQDKLQIKRDKLSEIADSLRKDSKAQADAKTQIMDLKKKNENLKEDLQRLENSLSKKDILIESKIKDVSQMEERLRQSEKKREKLQDDFNKTKENLDSQKTKYRTDMDNFHEERSREKLKHKDEKKELEDLCSKLRDELERKRNK